MAMSFIERLRKNHGLMMVVCCAVPLVILLIVVYGFGVSRGYLTWFILLLCPLMHIFMMKDMHKQHTGKKSGKGGCH